MVQRILSFLLVLGVILWIVLIYVPDSLLALPTIGFGGAGSLLAGLAAASLAAIVAIQAIVLRSTARSIPARDTSDTTDPALRMNRAAEIFWTAFPLAMTLVLAWACYPLWRNLTQR